MNNYPIGIMQGRLCNRIQGRIQAFPAKDWKKEFETAKKLELDEIEFIFDHTDHSINPLITPQGRTEMVDISQKFKVRIKSVIADYFMTSLLVDEDENIELLKNLVQWTKEIGAEILELPFVDNSTIRDDQQSRILGIFDEIKPHIDRTGILLGLETDLPAPKFREFLEKIDHVRIGANYDTGNSAGLGYDPTEEMQAYGDRIFNVHIKDRILGGTTVKYGTGSTNFESVFKGLSEAGYRGSFILQGARGASLEEDLELAGYYRQFVKSYIDKYLVQK